MSPYHTRSHSAFVLKKVIRKLYGLADYCTHRTLLHLQPVSHLLQPCNATWHYSLNCSSLNLHTTKSPNCWPCFSFYWPKLHILVLNSDLCRGARLEALERKIFLQSVQKSWSFSITCRVKQKFPSSVSTKIIEHLSNSYI